jgi:hypothetical protein
VAINLSSKSRELNNKWSFQKFSVKNFTNDICYCLDWCQDWSVLLPLKTLDDAHAFKYFSFQWCLKLCTLKSRSRCFSLELSTSSLCPTQTKNHRRLPLERRRRVSNLGLRRRWKSQNDINACVSSCNKEFSGQSTNVRFYDWKFIHSLFNVRF